MYQEMFTKANDQMDQMFTPARKMQQMMVDHMSRMVEFQVACMRSYSDLCMEQLQAMQSVKTPEDMQAFLNQHADLVKTASERMSADMTKVVGLQRDFGEDLQKVTQDSLTGLMDKVKPATAKTSTSKRGS